MVDLIEAPASPVAARPSRRRLWIALAAVVIVLAAGSITAVAVSFRYLHAAPLTTIGGRGWLAPDTSHEVSAGPYMASVIPPRLGQRQTFELDLYNSSRVAQTVLGLTSAKRLASPVATAEPLTLRISAGPISPDTGTAARYTAKPVTIAPGGQYSLRLTHLTSRGAREWCGRSEFFTEISLRVRVGAFTRTEILDLRQWIMEIRSPDQDCD